MNNYNNIIVYPTLIICFCFILCNIIFMFTSVVNFVTSDLGGTLCSVAMVIYCLYDTI